MTDIGPNVPKHLDRTIGVQEGQKIFSYKESGFWVLKYNNQPDRKACSYITAGIGRHILEQSSGSRIRQELMITVWEEFESLHPEHQLASLSLDLIDRHIPIPNNQVIPWSGGVFEGHNFSAVYCTSARHMPEEFEIIEDDPCLIFVWLIPIYPEEQAFINESGWSEFEKIIENEQPDFFNLKRPLIV